MREDCPDVQLRREFIRKIDIIFPDFYVTLVLLHPRPSHMQNKLPKASQMHKSPEQGHTVVIIGQGEHAEILARPMGDQVAKQPCSGVTVVGAAVFGSGAQATTPEIVCLTKQAA
jgi:hypothetical protein